MQRVDLYRELGQILSAAEAAQVMASLRQDPLIWQSMQHPELFRLVSASADRQAEEWNPGQIALLALRMDVPLQALNVAPIQPLESIWQERALQAYQNVPVETPDRSAGDVVADAALLALALRERRRLTGS